MTDSELASQDDDEFSDFCAYPSFHGDQEGRAQTEEGQRAQKLTPEPSACHRRAARWCPTAGVSRKTARARRKRGQATNRRPDAQAVVRRISGEGAQILRLSKKTRSRQVSLVSVRWQVRSES